MVDDLTSYVWVRRRVPKDAASKNLGYFPIQTSEALDGSCTWEADFELHTQTMLKEVGDHFDTRPSSLQGERKDFGGVIVT